MTTQTLANPEQGQSAEKKIQKVQELYVSQWATGYQFVF